MYIKSVTIIGNGDIVGKLLSLLLVFGALIVLVGCSSNMVTAGKDGISIVNGEWIGQSDDRSFTMEYKIGTDGENLFIVSYSHPCGEKNTFVIPPKLMKVEIINSAFKTTTTDHSNLLPKLIITGKFVDSTHAEGTWDFYGDYQFQDIDPDMVCPAAKGTWKGNPE